MVHSILPPIHDLRLLEFVRVRVGLRRRIRCRTHYQEARATGPRRVSRSLGGLVRDDLGGTTTPRRRAACASNLLSSHSVSPSFTHFHRIIQYRKLKQQQGQRLSMPFPLRRAPISALSMPILLDEDALQSVCGRSHIGGHHHFAACVISFHLSSSKWEKSSSPLDLPSARSSSC